MNAIHFAASLVGARHRQDHVVQTIIEGLREAEDKEDLLVETIGVLVGLLHANGHLSPQIEMMLSVFAKVPDIVEADNIPDVHVVKAGDIDAQVTLELFNSVTEGTVRDDRVWNRKELPGGTHAVALEGSGFTARYVAVLGGTPAQVEELRKDLAAQDGR